MAAQNRMNIHSLFRYPIKGLSAEPLETMQLAPESGCLGDRLFALAPVTSKFDPAQPVWLHRRNFLNVAHQPSLAKLQACFDEASTSLTLRDQQTCLYAGDFKTGPASPSLSRVLNEVLGTSQLAPYQIARLLNGPLTDSQNPLISLLNHNSLNDLAHISGISTEELRPRFRGNLWIKDTPAWEERLWIGKYFQLGSAIVRVTEGIRRCAAIEVSLKSGKRESRLLDQLIEFTGEPCFGMYCEVIQRGTVTLSDCICEIHS